MTGPTQPLAAGATSVLGHIVPLLRDPLRFLRGMHDRGDVLTIRLDPGSLYASCTPELVDELLTRNGQSVDVGGRLWDTLRVLLGDGLATSNGTKHQRQRRLVQSAFTPQRLASCGPVMAEEARSMVPDRWRPEHARSVPKHAMALHGVGTRKCPGEHYSLTEVILVATIAARWQLQPVHEADPPLRMGSTPHPARPVLRVCPRQSRCRTEQPVQLAAVNGVERRRECTVAMSCRGRPMGLDVLFERGTWFRCR